jgi:cation-transporting ATPase 13A1
VASKVIKHSSLHQELPHFFHPHVAPATFLYLFWAYFRYSYYHLLGTPEFAWFFFILIVSVHALLFLIPQWSISIKAQFWYQKEKDVLNATFIFILPSGNNGSGAICKLERSIVFDKVLAVDIRKRFSSISKRKSMSILLKSISS